MNSNQISPQEKEQATTSWLPQLSQLRCWSFEVTSIAFLADFPSLILSWVDNEQVVSTTYYLIIRILNYIQLLRSYDSPISSYDAPIAPSSSQGTVLNASPVDDQVLHLSFLWHQYRCGGYKQHDQHHYHQYICLLVASCYIQHWNHYLVKKVADMLLEPRFTRLPGQAGVRGLQHLLLATLFRNTLSMM